MGVIADISQQKTAKAASRAAVPEGLIKIGKLGHVVINVRDVERSALFYTEVLGFEISDAYPEEMVPGGMVFLRCNPDHHGIALVGSRASMRSCAPTGSGSTLPAAVAPGVKSPSNFTTPTITAWRSIGGSIRSAATATSARQASGKARAALPMRCAARTRPCTTARCSKAEDALPGPSPRGHDSSLRRRARLAMVVT
jgi:hypothetical protein